MSELTIFHHHAMEFVWCLWDSYTFGWTYFVLECDILWLNFLDRRNTDELCCPKAAYWKSENVPLLPRLIASVRMRDSVYQEKVVLVRSCIDNVTFSWITAWFMICDKNWATSRENVSSGIVAQVRLKPACSATETSRREGEQDVRDRCYLIVQMDKPGLRLKINACTFNFWVLYVPESVASFREIGR